MNDGESMEAPPGVVPTMTVKKTIRGMNIYVDDGYNTVKFWMPGYQFRVLKHVLEHHSSDVTTIFEEPPDLCPLTGKQEER